MVWQSFGSRNLRVGYDVYALRRYVSRRKISIRSLPDDNEIASLPGRGMGVEWMLRFSPDGHWLAAGYGKPKVGHGIWCSGIGRPQNHVGT